MLRFFSYSFTASDGSEGSTAVSVVSPCSIMILHGFISKEVMRAKKQRYRLRQTTSHSSLLVARQGDVSSKLNQAFLLVDSFNFNFVDEERSDSPQLFFNPHFQSLNAQHQDVVEANSLNIFKNRLDKHCCRRSFRFHYYGDAFEELCSDIQQCGLSYKH